MRAFGPSVGITVAVAVHLLQTNHNRRPVVGLCQGDFLTEFIIFNKGLFSGAFRRLASHSAAGQGDRQRILAFCHITVHQPLFGDSNTELAGYIGIDQQGFRNLAAAAFQHFADALCRRFIFANLNSHFDRGEFRQEGHRADVAGIAFSISIAVLFYFGDGILAERQIGDGDALTRRHPEDVRIRFILAQYAVAAGDPQGLPAYLLDLDIEGTVGIRHLLTVDKHVLHDFQLAGLQRVLYRELIVIIGLVFFGAVVIQFQVTDICRITVEFVLGQRIGDLNAFLFDGQIIPDHR